MAKGKFVSYLRVSTDKQGRSGLGLAAQRDAVERYLNGGRWTLAAEYVETESGKRNDRPKLAAALAHAKAIGATVVFALTIRNRKMPGVVRAEAAPLKRQLLASVSMIALVRAVGPRLDGSPDRERASPVRSAAEAA